MLQSPLNHKDEFLGTELIDQSTRLTYVEDTEGSEERQTTGTCSKLVSRSTFFSVSI